MTSRDKPGKDSKSAGGKGGASGDRDKKPYRAGAKPAGEGRPERAGKPFGAGTGGRNPERSGKPSGKPAFAAKSYGAKKDDREKPAAVAKDGAKPSFKRDRTLRAEETAAATATGEVPQRISKIMARAGVASRRDIERMILEGRVSLNGKVLDSPVVNATLADHIEVDGQPMRGIERTRLWLYHKPAGLVTTNSDPEGRPTVFERLPGELPRVLSIGRLDINTEGLLLLTNDGGLARVLELPATGWLRRYRVRAHGTIAQEALDKLKDGIAVDGVLYGAIDATLDKVQGANVWITMGLREGKNREIKNVMAALGLDVNRLIRLSYGPFQLGELPEGHVQEIKGRTLRDQLGPRLISEAKANFDAPIYGAEVEPEPEAVKPTKVAATSDRPAFREKPEDKRERALSRLDTKRDDSRGRPDRGAAGDRKSGADRGFGADRKAGADRKFGSDRGSRPERGSDRGASPFSRDGGEDRPKRDLGQRARKANVWMAPGARPLAEKKAGDATVSEATDKPVRRERPEGAPKTKRYGRKPDGKPMKTTKRFDPDRKSGADRKSGGGAVARPDPGLRVVVNRADDDKEWIRSSEIQDKDDRGGGRKGGFGDRGDRKGGFGDRGDRKPREGGDRPPRRDGERSFSDKPRGDRPFGDRKPREDGARTGERPARAFVPSGDRPARSDSRPFSDKPRGKSFGGKPSGDKPAGARTFGAKPGGGKPGGGRPFGGKAGGGGRPPAGGKPRGRG